MNKIDSFMGEYRWLSNFHLCSILYNGLVYPSSENAYQAAKCKNEDDKLLFVGISPRDARKLGQQIEMRSDWDIIKLSVMRAITDIKFNDHFDLKQLLLNTRDKELIEGNNWNDTYWGICKGIGNNHLGKILMAKRQELSLFEK